MATQEGGAGAARAVGGVASDASAIRWCLAWRDVEAKFLVTGNVPSGSESLAESRGSRGGPEIVLGVVVRSASARGRGREVEDRFAPARGSASTAGIALLLVIGELGSRRRRIGEKCG